MVSKYPHLALFRVLLLQLHSLALTDQARRPAPSSSSGAGAGAEEETKSLQCWRFLEVVYRQSQVRSAALPRTIVVAANAHPDLPMQRNIILTLPRLRGIGSLQSEVRLSPPLRPVSLSCWVGLGWVVAGAPAAALRGAGQRSVLQAAVCDPLRTENSLRRGPGIT